MHPHLIVIISPSFSTFSMHEMDGHSHTYVYTLHGTGDALAVRSLGGRADFASMIFYYRKAKAKSTKLAGIANRSEFRGILEC